MKKTFLPILLCLVLTASTALAGGVPRKLAVFELGESVQKYLGHCRLDTISPMPDAPFLTEAHIKGGTLPGVRGGSLVFGNCVHPEKILRIKIKFEDRSQKLFKRLLKLYKERFGDAQNWLGDPFHNVIAWEWVFTEKDDTVNVVLMWSRDPELRPGVSIKMTWQSRLEQEFDCFQKKHRESGGGKGRNVRLSLGDFVPR